MSLRATAVRPRGGRLVPFALAAAMCAGLLGVMGGPVSPVAADDNPSAPAQQGGGSPSQGDGGQGSGAGQGDGVPSGPQQDGGGALPGEKPTDSAPGADSGPRPYTDAAPPVDPGFVDAYTRMYKKVERGKLKVRNLGEDLVAANQVIAATNSDLVLALRVRNKADFQLSDASQQFDQAVQDMYITGTTDVDVILSVLGSKPDDVLRNIDAVVYLRSATGRESADYEFASTAAVVADSAAAAAMIQADEDRKRVETVRKALAKTKKQLKKDQKELQKLISVAAPQTVVGGNGCPKAVLEGTVPEGVNVKQLCNVAVRTAASPQAAFAIKWALVRLGAPYACEGIGRLDAWRYDCSSYVSRAYAEGAGLKTAGNGWAPSTRNMVPWDGATLDPHYAVIPPKKIRPGDLVLYDTCPEGEVCPYRHVVMYLGPAEPGGVPLMAHTNSCGDVAHVSPFTGTDAPNLLGVRRVVPAYGEKVFAKAGAFETPGKADKPGKPGSGDKKPKKPAAKNS
jgi:cell wall-associated NlpC family hydrolase